MDVCFLTNQSAVVAFLTCYCGLKTLSFRKALNTINLSNIDRVGCDDFYLVEKFHISIKL